MPTPQEGQFNLNAIIAGSEGTLAVVTGIKVKLTPLPTVKRLIVAKYLSFDDSLRAANYFGPSGSRRD